MNRRVTINVPADRTPEEEAELVARVAAAYENAGTNVTIDVEVSEEVDYKSVSPRTEMSSRWNR